jgi:aromatic ring-opening dioxygenase catalytic subunit (LigB family)
MFPDPFEIPLVEVSIDEGLDPERHIAIGKAIDALRYVTINFFKY